MFEKLNDRIRAIIKEVHTISATLDKVTTGGTSYTVIVTYFFYQGSIRTVLNALFIMTSEHLDGSGTAEMLCNTLCSTLGLSEEELRNKLEHITYDGVYEVSENRIRGGGGMSLIKHVADFLKLGPDIVTGGYCFRSLF